MTELGRSDELREPDVTERQQQREYVRAPASRPVHMTLADRSVSFDTYSIDLSGGGLLLAGPCALSLGERICFSLTAVEDRPAISGTGSVLRIGPGGECAIEIEQISDGDRRRLVRFVFECQRLERRRELAKEERHER